MGKSDTDDFLWENIIDERLQKQTNMDPTSRLFHYNDNPLNSVFLAQCRSTSQKERK